ncbi:chemotaxis protein CheB [Sinobacterium caligoides]|uniref:chemotaxis protein CheB n=1 Tax=Sinobacterium caligoides TaxID=933926 RepID=UPI0013C3280E|nr:chemotaxis protein CheB [Sinobacterium caligoides]
MNPRVGLVVDDPLQQHQLKVLLQEHGYQLGLLISPEQLTPQHIVDAAVHLWLLCLADVSRHEEVLESLLSDAEVPVLIEDGSEQWADEEGPSPRHRRLIKQLNKALPVLSESDAHVENPILSRAQEVSEETQVACNVWVLGVSLGGPEAVCEFLSMVPADLPVAFVYAQHIDEQFNETLLLAVSKQSSMPAKVLRSGDRLRHGELGLMPVRQRLKLLPLGQVMIVDEPWPGPFSPSIDCLMSDVAHHYGRYSGGIIFSGMGDDGAEGSKQMTLAGGRVWLQSFDSCANSAMPEATAAVGNYERIATPAELAAALVDEYKQVDNA